MPNKYNMGLDVYLMRLPHVILNKQFKKSINFLIISFKFTYKTDQLGVNNVSCVREHPEVGLLI